LPGVSDLFFAQATGNLDFVINLADSFANFGIIFESGVYGKTVELRCGGTGRDADRGGRTQVTMAGKPGVVY